jgi:hypothetical protein
MQTKSTETSLLKIWWCEFLYMSKCYVRYLSVYVWRELLRIVVVEGNHPFDRHVGVNITPPVRPASMRDWTTAAATTTTAAAAATTTTTYTNTATFTLEKNTNSNF